MLSRLPTRAVAIALPSCKRALSSTSSLPTASDAAAASLTHEELEAARSMAPTNVTLQEMLQLGQHPGPATSLYSANFLRREIPIRVARQLSRLERLPYGLCIMPSIVRVRHWYLDAFRALRVFSKPLRTTEEQEHFTSVLQSHYMRFSGMHFMVARGLNELRHHINTQLKVDVDLTRYPELHEQLDNFYLSRVGIRSLVAHHLEIQRPPRPGHAGIICIETCPHEVAQDAISSATLVCQRTFQRAPKVSVHGKRRSHFPYVPSHIYYILFELIKNSMKAVAEFHQQAETLPPIRVVIADGKNNEDCAIKISDEGGGMPRSLMPKIWSYLFSSSPIDFGAFESMNDFDNAAPMAGLGIGLPISRVYAQYFRGDLQLLSMEGYGTDAYVHLHRLGNLPEPSISMPGSPKRTRHASSLQPQVLA